MDFSDPVSNLKQFDIHDGQKIADFGCGSGAYSLAAAPMTHGGTVYALDVQQDLLKRLSDEAHRLGISNIETVWCDVEKSGGTKLGSHSIDRVILSNILFQAEDKKSLVSEIRRVLKENGKVLVIDWADSFSGMGPSAELVVPASKAEALFAESGFIKERDISPGAHHYGFIFKK